MRKVLVLTLVLFLIIGVSLAIASEGPASSSKKSATKAATKKSATTKTTTAKSQVPSDRQGKNIFELAQKDIQSDIKIPKVTEVQNFNTASDYIKTWDSEVEKAKDLSVRGNKAEIAKRRMGKFCAQ